MSLDSSQNVLIDQEAKKDHAADELRGIEGSALARDLKKYLVQGYSCAGSILLVSPRYLDKPEELAWAAAGFDGVMYQRELSGFLTGGIMALGFARGMLDKPREEAKEYLRELVTEY